MKKITLLSLIMLLTVASISSQTIAWSSDSEDLTDFQFVDEDGDGKNWAKYTNGSTSSGFSQGAILYSRSWDSSGALTPDNRLLTPEFLISTSATNIYYKMKVTASDSDYFEEKFSVIIFDINNQSATETTIHEETLTAGGNNSVKEIEAVIPISFAGKTVKIIVRHYDCTNQNEIYIDDLEVSYTTTLSNKDYNLGKISISPNSIKDITAINTNKTIDKITITNSLGQRVKVIDKEEIYNNSINLSSLSKGFYFMLIEAENKYQTIRFVKE